MTDKDFYEKVSYVPWLSGSHISFNGNIYDTLKLSICRGMMATQFFMGDSTAFKRHKVSKKDLEKSLRLCERFPLHVYQKKVVEKYLLLY